MTIPPRNALARIAPPEGRIIPPERAARVSPR